MSSPHHTRIVAVWLNDLAAITGGDKPAEEIAAKVAAMTGVVADSFPDSGAFTSESVAAVGLECPHHFPTFGELHRILGKWWDAHRPAPIGRLPSEFEDAPHDPGRWLWGWLHRRGEPEQRRVLHLGLIRAKAGTIYEYLVRRDTEAAAIAVRHGWRPEATPAREQVAAEADWSDPAVVTQALDKARAPLPDGQLNPFVQRLVGMLGGLVQRHAPGNAGLLAGAAGSADSPSPAPTGEDGGENAPQPPAYVPKPLDPAVLAEIRRQNAAVIGAHLLSGKPVPAPPRDRIPPRPPANDSLPPPPPPARKPPLFPWSE